MSETKTTSSCGITFYSLLAIAFITLKLAQIGPVAAWSWWWVLSPLWIPAVIGIFILLVIAVAISIYCR